MNDTQQTTPRTVTATVTRTFENITVAEKGSPLECPACHDDIRRSIDILEGTIDLIVDQDGVGYGSQGTTIDWDSGEQLEVEIDGETYPVLICASGCTFIHLDVPDIQ